ncbi:unnamed protein product [Prunus armeniaca]|uniref:Uncharacterized protein n=1 Tax=Prunus armeniaca TaxID=36596 RepID=A0A6J5TJ57_PRUAR|nr:unnamed protein product [Prunus armeniaca]
MPETCVVSDSHRFKVGLKDEVPNDTVSLCIDDEVPAEIPSVSYLPNGQKQCFIAIPLPSACAFLEPRSEAGQVAWRW